jgi:hypothetical protein
VPAHLGRLKAGCGQNCPPHNCAFGASTQLSAVSFQPGPPEDHRPICVYLRLSAAHIVFANSANALQSNQAAEIVAPHEEFGA